MTEHNKTNEMYFTQIEDEVDYLGELRSRLDNFHQELDRTRLIPIWRRLYKSYYNANTDYNSPYMNLPTGQIDPGGDVGELAHLNISHFRNQLQHVLNLTTKERPAFQTRATNTDTKSLAQAKLGNGLLEYYLREKQLETCLKQAAEYAILLGEGFLLYEWNSRQGEIYDYHPETKAPIYQGDLQFKAVLPSQVARDVHNSNNEQDWYIVTLQENKFDVSVRFGVDITNQGKDYFTSSYSELVKLFGTQNNDESAYVSVHHFYHKPTESTPEGEYTVFVDDQILYRGPLPYRRLPIARVVHSDLINTPFGFSPSFDALPIQEALNILDSTILSNQSTFGVQNIWTEPGSNLDVRGLAGGMNHLESETKPEAIQLTRTAPEIFNYKADLIREMGQILGVSEIQRGVVEAHRLSGSAMALLVSQAIQFHSSFQQSYYHLLEDVGTGCLEILRDYAKTPRIINIIGKNDENLTKHFTGDDISEVNRVTVETISAASQTLAGRVDMADKLLQRDMISGAEYITLLKTGRLETMTEDKESQLLLIRSENERLSAGQQIQAVFTEDHRLHIQEHRSVLASPEAKEDPTIVAAVLAHIQDHIDVYKSTSPEILELLGIPPLATAQPTTVGNPAPQPLGNPEPTIRDVNMPAMPMNPLTNERTVE